MFNVLSYVSNLAIEDKVLFLFENLKTDLIKHCFNQRDGFNAIEKNTYR